MFFFYFFLSCHNFIYFDINIPILFKPFKVGDSVTAGGATGTVKEVGIFSSIFTTPDNQKIIVPNGAITKGSITNINAYETRRIDLVIGVDYKDDIKKAKEVLTAVINSNEKVLTDKPVGVVVSELAEKSVNFTINVWVKTSDFSEVKFYLLENIKLSFDKEGITIPTPE